MLDDDSIKFLADIGRQLHVRFSNFRGKIQFNLTPNRNYANFNMEESCAAEFDGSKIRDIRSREKRTQ